MIYLIQVTVYSALLYAVYLLILKNRASHDWNRLYLLLCATLPLIIPLIRIPAFFNSMPLNTGALNILLPEVSVFSKNNATANHFDNNWSNIIVTTYVLVSLGILCWTAIQYIIFRRFVNKNKYEVLNGVKVLLDTQTGPGSFLNYVFFPGNEINPAIFEHELAHIRLKHSRDILFIRLLQAVFWPNLMLYIILKELKIVHEFQADTYAVKNKESYITTLLNDTFSTSQFYLSHTFFYHPLKRRIMMLQKSPISRNKLRMAMLKTGIIATTLLAAGVYLQSCKPQPNKKGVSNDTTMEFVSVPDTARVKLTEERTDLPKPKVFNTTIDPSKQLHIDRQRTVFDHVEKMPQADSDLSEFLSKNIKYPESARKMSIQGKVFVKFIVNENGDIINPIILHSPDAVLSTEALRVIKMMPKWKPGEQNGKKVAVYFILPITFKLDN